MRVYRPQTINVDQLSKNSSNRYKIPVQRIYNWRGKKGCRASFPIFACCCCCCCARLSCCGCIFFLSALLAVLNGAERTDESHRRARVIFFLFPATRTATRTRESYICVIMNALFPSCVLYTPNLVRAVKVGDDALCKTFYIVKLCACVLRI